VGPRASDTGTQTCAILPLTGATVHSHMTARHRYHMSLPILTSFCDLPAHSWPFSSIPPPCSPPPGTGQQLLPREGARLRSTMHMLGLPSLSCCGSCHPLTLAPLIYHASLPGL
jgi:hypothetical protein